jgi:hypothetical protein
MFIIIILLLIVAFVSEYLCVYISFDCVCDGFLGTIFFIIWMGVQKWRRKVQLNTIDTNTPKILRMYFKLSL